MKYIIAYDIVNNNIRTRVMKLLKDYGLRIQDSVFEAKLDLPELNIVIKKVNGLIDSEKDNVRIYPCCLDCENKIKDLGKNKQLDYDDMYIV